MVKLNREDLDISEISLPLNPEGIDFKDDRGKKDKVQVQVVYMEGDEPQMISWQTYCQMMKRN